MKIIIATTPIRPSPTQYPPVGSLALVKYLRLHGFDDVAFYNIDGNRPTFEQAVDHICDQRPDVLGISSVVSTAYAYTKALSIAVKERSPETLIVVGGNLAASAEVLLRRTGTDLCVLGEGEKILLDVVRKAEHSQNAWDFADIPGLMLLDREGEIVNTGYATPLTTDEICDFDWQDLDNSSDIEIFIPPMFSGNGVRMPAFQHDPRTFEPHRREKRFAMIPDSKGCVARCTFCHRWDKGMRYIPVQRFMARLDELIAKYNVGFVSPATENFGSDRRWVKEFCAEMKKRDVLWCAGAVRTKTVSPDMIAMMKDAGCVSLSYGMETGSPSILEVMEKKTSLQDNMNAQKWTVEAGFNTVVQLVLGMPGESPKTVRETTEFCKYCFTLSPTLNPNNFSINYAQALPGTPLYEYARRSGLIEDGLDGEENYLNLVSDRDAHDEFSSLNFTDYPTLMCHSWRPRITIEVNYAYVRKFGLARYQQTLRMETETSGSAPIEDDGYHANPKRLIKGGPIKGRSVESADPVGVSTEGLSDAGGRFPSLWSLVSQKKLGLTMICYPVIFYRLRHFVILMVLLKNLMRFGPRYTCRITVEYLVYRLGLRNGKRFTFGYKSLRKIMRDSYENLPEDTSAMLPLRRGR